MHPLQNGSQVTERPANKPPSGLFGWFTESGEGNVPSYPGADWFNHVIAEFQNMLSSEGIEFNPENDDHLSQAFEYLKKHQIKKFDNIAEMINMAAVGDICKVGKSSFKRLSNSSDALSGFSTMSPCFFSDLGGVNDGVTSNNEVLDLIDSLYDTLVHIIFDCPNQSANFGYNFSTDPDLGKYYVSSESNGFVISFSSIGSPKNIKLLTNLRVRLTAYDADFTHPQNTGLNIPALNVGAACISPNSEISYPVILNDGSVNLVAIDGYNTVSSFTGEVTSDQIAWAIASDKDEGFISETSVGDTHECCYIWNGATTSGYAIITIRTDNFRYLIRFAPNLRVIDIVKVNRAGDFSLVYNGATGDNTNNYVITPNGGCAVFSVRVISRVGVELYINDTLFKKIDLDGSIAQVGFLVSASGTNPSNGVQIYKPMITKNKTPKGGRKLNIVAVGDSITYGTQASITWPEMLSICAQNSSGIGELSVSNLAVGGMTWDYFANGPGSTIDYSQYDYALIMLGTNDTQFETALNVIGTNVDKLLDKIIAQGCTPIVGMFPIWTESQFSGVGDDGPKNTRFAPKVRAEIKARAVAKGVSIANALTYVGNNTGFMHDNIHPASDGQVAIAAAFTAALSTKESPSIKPTGAISRLFDTKYGFDTLVDPLTLVKSNRVVNINGGVLRRNGDSVLGNLPLSYAPKNPVKLVGVDSSNGTVIVTVGDDGVVLVPGGAPDSTITINGSWNAVD
ncbi:SGNH/GDSL hydrolase family protein [Vibrio parahaemolyticus]|nr:SGNH/GDSL hydrolase family protein [Vibrio parahaemolyticus]